jgi:Flp pilus assembly protein TadD
MTDEEKQQAAFWYGAGCKQRDHGRLEQALACFDRVQDIEPRNPEIFGACGFVLYELRRFDQAASAFREAVSIAPSRSDLHHGLGMVCEELPAPEEAIACYRRAIQCNPAADGAWNNLGRCLQALGRFDEATEAFSRALAIRPNFAPYYRNQAYSHRVNAGAPFFAQLAGQVALSGARPARERADLHSSYAKALADNGRQEESFAQQVLANNLMRSVINYDEAAVPRQCEWMSGVFTADMLAEHGGQGDPSSSPVFIVGMPRSGSTLVEQILASHPDVFGVEEQNDFPVVLTRHLKRTQTDGPDIHPREITGAQWRRIGADYLAAMARHTRGASFSRITDKHLFNFGFCGFIHLALPNARIIHIRRAPVETCLSIYSHVLNIPFGHDLAELGRHYLAYSRLMAHWRAVLPPDRFLEVDYEALVDQPEPQIRRLLAHCGLEWDARCLAFHRTGRYVRTASATQVRQPLYRTSLRRWRPAKESIAPLLDALGPDLAKMETGRPA